MRREEEKEIIRSIFQQGSDITDRSLSQVYTTTIADVPTAFLPLDMPIPILSLKLPVYRTRKLKHTLSQNTARRTHPFSTTSTSTSTFSPRTKTKIIRCCYALHFVHSSLVISPAQSRPQSRMCGCTAPDTNASKATTIQSTRRARVSGGKRRR